MRTKEPMRRGFSLIEATVGLALIGVALLLTMSLMAQKPRTEGRLAAHHEALRVMEMQLEQLRSVAALPEDGEIDLTGLPRSLPPAARDLRLWAESEALPGRSLYKVTLRATYSVGEMPHEMSLETMVFRAR